MKTVVAVIVYNRFQNLKRWLNCWAQCDQTNAELVIIHTGDEIEKFKEACGSVTYIHRENVGYDIGSFQDVCRNRLAGFPDFDYLLWCTDDTIPMAKNFVQQFVAAMKPGVGIACMQISKSVAPHVRTTGFMISNGTAARIQFQVDPITTKTQCYFFEHRGGKQTMTDQIRAMGLQCAMVSPANTSPMWDSGYWKRMDREQEHYQIFGGKPIGDKVTFVCTIYNSYPQIISSLLLQTHKNWELILIHDGPSSNGMKSYIPNDPRVIYMETKERAGNWGHSLRQMALNKMELGDYTVISNADNYYTPVFIEYMLRGFKKTHTAVASYCDKMVHSYKAWDIIPVKLERGFLDCGGVMVKSAVAKEVGWRDTTSHSSDFTYFSDIAARYSWRNFIPVKGCLFVHN